MRARQEVWTWVRPIDAGRLHHVARVVDPEAFDRECRGVVTTTCGRTGLYAIPGVFSRIGTPRCVACCNRLGIPQGHGSPINDARLREWLPGAG